jgi:hypothetical protein
VLDALEQALHERRPMHRGGLVHHSDRAASTCPSTTPSAWPWPASSLRSSSVGDSYHNALAESINRLYKAGVVHRRGPWPCPSCSARTARRGRPRPHPRQAPRRGRA